MTSDNQHSPASRVRGAPVPKPGAPPFPKDPAPTTDLAILETLSETPVAQHLAIFEALHASLAADLDSTSQEQQ